VLALDAAPSAVALLAAHPECEQLHRPLMISISIIV